MSGRSRGAVRASLAGISAAAALAACSTDAPDTARDTESPASRTNSAYADGEYTARGWYGGLPSSIEVTVTLDDGVITDAEVAPQATDPTSRDFQERFAAAVPDLVEGRPIDEVRLDRVAGSSGTPNGFNEAIARIKDEASV
ncbi:FMN-binding protein [Streptomyces fulvoviolaceus]|uniref:FMN-binding protein n=1 Tax=Streptomyces fulvoviolaceus TaxID=285535 RepID=UPI0021C0A445|nr:FMN-binding protein [Streptomyces fulvoviolaceus]MCT9084015.1 FMN-binding protein [Streptomyces fulvoviolaceus]